MKNLKNISRILKTFSGDDLEISFNGKKEIASLRKVLIDSISVYKTQVPDEILAVYELGLSVTQKEEFSIDDAKLALLEKIVLLNPLNYPIIALGQTIKILRELPDSYSDSGASAK